MVKPKGNVATKAAQITGNASKRNGIVTTPLKPKPAKKTAAVKKKLPRKGKAAARKKMAPGKEDNNDEDKAEEESKVTEKENLIDPNVAGKDENKVDADNVAQSSSSLSSAVEKPRQGKKRQQPMTVEASVKKKKGLFAHEAGTVLSVGEGLFGQLGLGEDRESVKKLTKLKFDQKVAVVCAGAVHTVFLTEEGDVYTCGCNDSGALGRITPDDEGTFEPGRVEVPGTAPVIQITAGDSHTAVLTDEGLVYAWGSFRDSSGEMGFVTKDKSQPLPIQVLPGVVITKIASGDNHLIMLTAKGLLYSMGCAEQGQIGRVAECFSNRGGRKGIEVLLTPMPVPTRRLHGKALTFNNIWAGSWGTFACHQDSGEIYVCGLNNYYQLGLKGDNCRYMLEVSHDFSSHSWEQIASGPHHTVALDTNGRVFCIGRKEYGRLGMGPDAEDCKVLTEVPALINVRCISVSASSSCSYAIAEDGTLYAWGMGDNGVLGTGDEDDRLYPVAMDRTRMLDLKAVSVSSGGQHAVVLSVPSSSNQSSGNSASSSQLKPSASTSNPSLSASVSATSTKS